MQRVCFLALVLAMLGAGPLWAAETKCSGRKDAYSSEKRVPESKRRAGIEIACDEARNDLIGQAWIAGVLTRRSVSRRTATNVELEHFETSRTYSKIHRLLLEDGECEREGDKKELYVRYCIPEENFEAAVEQLADERRKEVVYYQGRFAAVEQALAEGDFRWAADQIQGLIRVVRSNVLDDELYTSPLSGEALSFGEWLERWKSEISFDEDYIRDSLDEAERSIEAGHLGQAEGFLADVKRVAPRSSEVRQYEREIAGLREKRRRELDLVGRSARSGRFADARRHLEKARRIDADDATSLKLAQKEMDGLKAEFFVLNPRWMVGGHLGLGTLGLDTGDTATNVGAATGQDFDSTLPLNFGLDGSWRLGRFWENHWQVSYGVEEYEFPNGEKSGVDLEYGQIATAIGFRTLRKTGKSFAVTISAGLAAEVYRVSGVSLAPLDDTESANGLFARLEIERKVGAFYIQRGFGFEEEDSGPSVFALTDTIQFGFIIRLGAGTTPRK